MNSNFKNIHIGKFIQLRVNESNIDLPRICNFMKCTETEINEMYTQENLSTEVLLRWSKLLEYDFFRLYSQHLILYAPLLPLSGKPKLQNFPFPEEYLYPGNDRLYSGTDKQAGKDQTAGGR